MPILVPFHCFIFIHSTFHLLTCCTIYLSSLFHPLTMNSLWGHLSESSSSSQGISLKRWAVLVESDVASDSRYGIHVYFKHQVFFLYFDKSIRSEVLHFQLPLTQIYYFLVVLQTELLFQRFSQNRVYLWLHCNWCLCLGCVPHSSVYFLSF